MFRYSSMLYVEKRSVFLINFFLILFIIFFFLYDVSVMYFFYFILVFTSVLSYLYFRKSKSLARALITTNLFIFFYFLYPFIELFVYEIFESFWYILVIFYHILIAYLFLILSGNSKRLLGNIEKFSSKVLVLVLMCGIIFGFLFFLIGEPISQEILKGKSVNSQVIWFIILSSFLVAFSEQMIFSGFLFNTYKGLSSRYHAFYQTAIIFVLFHLLRFEILFEVYYKSFGELFSLYIILYYVLLFFFMISALYFYSFRHEKFEGNFIYPLCLHFLTDFVWLFFYFM